MNKHLLIRVLAVSTAAAVVFGLSSCNLGGKLTQSSETVTTSLSTEPTTAATSATETEPDKSQIAFNAVKKIAVETTEKKKAYQSKGADECAVIATGEKKKINLTTPDIKKTGDSSNLVNSSIFGTNAAVLAMDNSRLYIAGGTVSTAAKGAAGIFGYAGHGNVAGITGDGTRVTLSDAKVTTTGDDSAGIATSYGATFGITNLTVETSGKNSPAIRLGKDGGNVTITKGSYITNGTASPVIYGTGKVTVSGSFITANNSEAVVVDENSTVSLASSVLTANNTVRNENARFRYGILLYQKEASAYFDNNTMAVFTMAGGTITNKAGHVFHVTNTKGVINLSGTVITNEDKEGVLLSVCPDGWSGGNNVAILNATNTVLNGNILVAKEGKLTVNFSTGTKFTGAFRGVINDEDGKSVSKEPGIIHVNLAPGATWTLTDS